MTECHPALEKKDAPSHAAPWMTLEDTLLSEISESQEDKHCVTAVIWGTQSSQIHRGRRQAGCLQGRGPGRWSLMPTEFVLQNGNVLEVMLVMEAQRRVCM